MNSSFMQTIDFRVFCQSPQGYKMNYATPSNLAAEMNCSKKRNKSFHQNSIVKLYFKLLVCARDQEIFKAAGFGFNLQCKDNGNYAAIQNQNEQVFCVDRYGYSVSALMEHQPVLDCNDYIYYQQEDDFHMAFHGTVDEL